jgi:hypothetical protein
MRAVLTCDVTDIAPDAFLLIDPRHTPRCAEGNSHGNR